MRQRCIGGINQINDNNKEEDDFVASQEDIDEINKELEDLFGSPMSSVRL